MQLFNESISQGICILHNLLKASSGSPNLSLVLNYYVAYRAQALVFVNFWGKSFLKEINTLAIILYHMTFIMFSLHMSSVHCSISAITGYLPIIGAALLDIYSIAET